MVLTALTGGKLSKLILKFNFLFIPRQGNRTKLTKLDVEHPEGGLWVTSGKAIHWAIAQWGASPGENAPSTQQAVAKLNAFLNESAWRPRNQKKSHKNQTN